MFTILAGACGIDSRDLGSETDDGGQAGTLPDANPSNDAHVDASNGRLDAPANSPDGSVPDAPSAFPDGPGSVPDASSGLPDVTSAPPDARSDTGSAPVDASADRAPDARQDAAPADARAVEASAPDAADAAALSPAMLSLAGGGFTNVALGMSQDVVFLVTNSGQQAGALNVQVTGPMYSRVASATNDCAASLAGNASCNITVRFSPTALGPQGGSVSASGTTAPIILAGNGACAANQSECSGVCVNLANDANNCGHCGHGCLTNGICSASLCQPITFVATNLTSNVVDLATDGNVVIWADSGDNTIDQVGSPGAAKIVLASGASNPVVSQPLNVGLEPSSGTIFWAQSDGTIGMATRGSANSAAPTNCSGTPPIAAINVAGASQVDILSPGFLATCSVGFSVLADTSFPSSQVGKSLTPHWFIGDVMNGQVLELGVSGSFTPNIVATIPLQSSVLYLVEDGSFVYWSAATGNGPAIFRAPLAMPTSTQSLLANAGGTVGGLATDGVNVYYQNGSGIFYIPVAGGAATRLTTLNGLFLRYAAGALYFASGGGIFKIATP
ncbi:MAG TPA: hypothetical protein VGL13_00595 [Polyangiaceae bacterium]